MKAGFAPKFQCLKDFFVIGSNWNGWGKGWLTQGNNGFVAICGGRYISFDGGVLQRFVFIVVFKGQQIVCSREGGKILTKSILKYLQNLTPKCKTINAF